MDSLSKQQGEMESLLRRAATSPLIARAISHSMRTAALLHLMHKPGEATDEAELANLLGLSSPAMRYHLTVLRHSNLITYVETNATGRYVATAGSA